jgi:hypothetical protein
MRDSSFRGRNAVLPISQEGHAKRLKERIVEINGAVDVVGANDAAGIGKTEHVRAVASRRALAAIASATTLAPTITDARTNRIGRMANPLSWHEHSR